MSELMPDTEHPIIEGVEIRKTYQLGRVKVPVLHGASIEIMPREWVAILGASGSGKSTLLHILGGLDRPDPDSGEVRYKGRRVELNRGSTTNHYRNRTIGFVFQFYHLLPELDVLENAVLAKLIPRTFASGLLLMVVAVIGAVLGAAFGAIAAGAWSLADFGLLPVEEQTLPRILILAGVGMVLGCASLIALTQLIQVVLIKQRSRSASIASEARTTINDFGLSHRIHHRPRELSGGERQRVAIARALGNGPDLLLADEPTGNLDAQTGREILDLLKERHEAGLTIVMVTHDPKVAAYADRIVELEDGRIRV
jgi:ABC-type lipoprotein export system ATPase subunit